MKKKHFLFLLLSICALYSSTAQIKIIPSPQKIVQSEGSFTFDKDTKINLNALDSFYANELVLATESALSITLGISNKASSNSVSFIKPSNEEALKKVLKKEKLSVDFSVGKEGYVLSVDSKEIIIIALTDAGIYYGIQTLKQLIIANSVRSSIPNLVIYDHPDIEVRAWQDDISRGPIPTMKVLKEQIQTMASYKLNYFSLYIEHVFKLQKHPGIAPQDGITKDEIDELSAFAKKHHVQLIGSYQSFGHMEETLKHPDYAYLAENDHIISPALPESYEFLEDVYEEIVPTFSGEYFNINCDETFGLGEGRSKTMVDTMGINGVYLYHIDKLNTSLKKYDKRILMWGDIVGNHPEIIKELPENITVMMWNYDAVPDFTKAITPFEDSGLNYWVAPGVSCWNNIFPNHETAKINIYNLIRDGFNHNAIGVFNTTWDDDGLNFFHNNWHGLIWGAENSWNAPKRPKDDDLEQSIKKREKRYASFNKAYDALFYGLKDESLISIINTFSDFHAASVREVLRNEKFFEPIFPIHLDYVKEGKKEDNEKLLKELESLEKNILELESKVTKHESTLRYVQFAMDQVRFLVQKNKLRIQLHSYINGEGTVHADSVRSRVQKMLEHIKRLKATYAQLWKVENRPYWLDQSLEKFDNVIEDLHNLDGYAIIAPSTQLSKNGRKITMQSLHGDKPVFYSTTQDTADLVFQKYTEPIIVNNDLTLRARVQEDNKTYGTSKEELVYHKAIGKLYKQYGSYSTYHPSYDGGGKYALLDGKQANAQDLKSGKWQGYGGQDIGIEIDLEKEETLHFFSMGFYQHTRSWVIFPKKVEIFVKNNLNDDFKLVQTIKGNIPPEIESAQKQEYTTTFNNLKARYIKVVAHYYGKLPEWHQAGSEYESMIFADEIIIK